ncbi:MAG: FG-GAP repeat protein, partial [Gemmatimonadaceae bacterium]|nr:FG-GAP repeat protein [Gloeobacterales cyanobacterium ES-bin-141]
RAYVVFGKANTTAVDLRSLGSGGFAIDGAAGGDGAGRSVSDAGDVNGDGIPDLLVGALFADAQGRSLAGRAYVVFGKANTTAVDLRSLGSGGFAIDGAAGGDRTGESVSGAGDVNGDGIPDLLVGADGATPQGRNGAGRAYVVFGKADTTTVDLANLGNGGFAIDGAAGGDNAGFSVSGAGDVNGDGLPDLLVGAVSANLRGRNAAGRAYVVFGKRTDTNPIDLRNVQLSAAPDLSSALRGAAVTLTGNNLTSVSAVSLGGASVPFAINSSTRLTAVVPAAAADGGNTLSLSTPLDGTVSLAFQVLPTPADAPIVSSVSPAVGPPDIRVEVAGTNLTGGTTVSFCNGTRASGRASATQLLFNVPNGATSGPVTVTTTNGSYNFLFTVP